MPLTRNYIAPAEWYDFDVNAPGTLSALPSVQQLVEILARDVPSFPHVLLVRAARSAIQQARIELQNGGAPVPVTSLAENARAQLQTYTRSSIQPVINATGVILHTNLGRAPLGEQRPISGYSNLEYDLTKGQRGRRDAHTSPLFEALLGHPALVVNNGAAATFLALNELAAGYEVIVSRGELIEIGDGFRIPEILTRSGAILREVGTTNRTRIEDYETAITDRTRLLLRVHPSNFHMTGFTARPELTELTTLGRRHGIPVYEDLGSGNIVDLRDFGVREPLVSESLDAGVNLVSFSGDKLLGGPQAGILAGDAAILQRLRKNPLFRVLRVDKLTIQALAHTLRHLLLEDWAGVPAIRMIRMTAEEIGERAAKLFPGCDLIPGESLVGGGSTPDQSIATLLVVAAKTHAARIESELRASTPAVIARIRDDQVVLDLRTVFSQEEQALKEAVMRVPGTCLRPY
jgi:L-seryl-tRNA(Ser) seleniumtransferase